MSTEANRTVVRRLNDAMQEFFHSGSTALIDEVLAPDFVHHGPGVPPDREGLKQMLPAFRAAFPDLRFTCDALVAEGDLVADRLTVHGTHLGDFMGVPATGMPFTIMEMHVARVRGARVVERWSLWDALGLIQQIGTLPAPAEA